MSKDPDVSAKGEGGKVLLVEAGRRVCTFDVDWKPDKMGCSLPSLPLPSTGRN